MKPTDTAPKINLGIPQDYPGLLSAIKERVRSAQYEALKAVNKELVGLYWDIGQMIVKRLEVEGWGKAVVKQLAVDLCAEFPGVGGFSASNLWRMKAFFEAYDGLEKLAPLVREIGWSHNLAIMERCKDPLEREFYLRVTRKFGIRGQDAVLSGGSGPTDPPGGGEPLHRYHPLQGEKPYYCGIRPARRPQTHWRGNL